ncbi:uncharacterized protein FOMMEDRAFT_159051 [Fomitiporia mediterranea MF3/22]|uniref:uncharacterized protein n=1 Tax=Fomitiporia mediterranea (strain MF3/22) TaxID=694068 RepID=UPI000440778E|nr:uncharacterized protein FOMMEDRAFT_159051 [Fomitiporia mediterranea MF3/22]EJD00375.1 hypothetical protein FOMMEDRAFT_159051 [Fomitiporia mediterranea MF3/22]
MNFDAQHSALLPNIARQEEVNIIVKRHQHCRAQLTGIRAFEEGNLPQTST